MKRLFSGLVAAALAFTLLPGPARAASPSIQLEDAAQVLSALEIMLGDQDGNLNLGNTITRAEFTKLAVAASPMRESVGDSASVAPYPDVPKTHWAAPYVQAAVQMGLVTGYLDGTFRPQNTITLAEAVTMVLHLLGYENSDFTGAFPAGQMAMYRNLDLDEGITASSDSTITRRDALLLFYNLMTAKTKAVEGASTYYLNLLKPDLVNGKGEIDMVALVNTAMEGPVVAEAGWRNSVPFDVASTTVYRAGKLSTLSAIQDLDVVYWSDSMRTIWAYNNKASGTYESVAPNPSAPTSITVAGKSYTIEDNSAAFALSDLGGYQVGDSITLLLGRDGGVAAVRGPDVATNTVIYGVITKAEIKSYKDSKGGTYDQNAITIFATDGTQPTYGVSNKSFKAGDLVQVVPGENGAQVKRLSSAQLSGRVSTDGTKLDKYPFASDARILDVCDGQAMRIYPSRLAGVTLEIKSVSFYLINTQGEITDLILKDVTGDLGTYGILTNVSEVSEGMNVSGNYTVDIGGREVPIAVANRVFNVKPGPVKLKGFESSAMSNTVDGFDPLTAVQFTRVDGNVATGSDNRKYTIADSVMVYTVDKGEYTLSSLSRVSDGGYTLTGYYEKPQSEGGQIRIVLAR